MIPWNRSAVHRPSVSLNRQSEIHKHRVKATLLPNAINNASPTVAPVWALLGIALSVEQRGAAGNPAISDAAAS